MLARERFRLLILLLFFLSGISGLVYQIVWTRLLVLVFGNTLLANSTVVAAFMAGLAAGSYFFGRFVDERPRRLVRLYALLEAGIGGFALLFPLLLSATTPIYTSLHRGLEGQLALLNLFRFAICFGLILVPTFLMGGTLPILLKRLVSGTRSIGQQLGFLYGLNTAGAVIGCLASGFVLLRVLGMQRSTWVAVAINLGVAAVAWLLARADVGWEPSAEAPEAAPRAEARADTPHETLAARLVLVGIGLSGFCALAYELLWTRMLNLFLNNNIYSFTATLATFLAGIALGSLLYSRFLSQVRKPVWLFAFVQLGIGACAYATPFIFSILQPGLFSRQSEALTLVKTAAIMIAPTVLMGIAVPLAVQIWQRGPRREGTTVGTVYAVNTLGSIFGAFAAGFLLVPYAGLHGGLMAVVCLNLLAAFLAVSAACGPRQRPAWAAACAALLALMYLVTPETLFRNLYQRAQPTADILHYEEGKIANVVVYDFFKSGYKDLYLNAIEEASSRLWHVQLFKLLGILPVMVHDDPGDALMVAFGAGMSAGASIQHVDRLDCVDLNPDVRGVAKAFTHENRDVINNPRLNLVVNDGRNALLLKPQGYSVIISDATNPKAFDSWTLYTREFYELVKSRLEPGGVFCQWLVIPLPADAIKVLLNTFRDVFPHTSFWCVYGSSQCLMLGTPERLAIDYQELAARLEPMWQTSGLAEYGIGDTDKFLSFLLLGEDELERALEGFTRLNTDDLPHAQFQVEGEVEGVRAFLDLLEHQSSVADYLTDGDALPVGSAERLEAYRSMSRRLHLGFLLNNRGEYEEARAVALGAGLAGDENVRSALRYDSKRKQYFVDRVAGSGADPSAHNSLGYIHWMAGNHEGAIAELERAVTLEPDFANAHANLARAYTAAGRYDDATEKWLELRRLNPAKPVLSMVRRELAMVHLLRRLRHEPRAASLYLALAEAHARSGAVVEAAGATRSAAELSPQDPTVQLRLAALYEDLELVDEALEVYRKLAMLAPNDQRFERKVTQFELLSADRAARQRWLNSNEIVLSLEGQGQGNGHPESCLRAARTWSEFPFEGRIDPEDLVRAASLYEESIATKPDERHAYADAARIYEALGEHGRAAALWRRGLKVAPGDRGAERHARRLELLHRLDSEDLDGGAEAEILVEIGVLSHLDGEIESALEVLGRAVALRPRDVKARTHLARSLVAAGRYPDAVEALEQGFELRPGPEEAGMLEQWLGQLRGLMNDRATAGSKGAEKWANKEGNG